MFIEFCESQLRVNFGKLVLLLAKIFLNLCHSDIKNEFLHVILNKKTCLSKQRSNGSATPCLMHRSCYGPFIVTY